LRKITKFVVSLLIIGLMAGVGIYAAPMFSLTSAGYSQGTQGFSFSFDNVYFNNYMWSAGHYGTSPYGYGSPISAQFGINQLSLKPVNMPALTASTGSFVPDWSNSSGQNNQYTWILKSGTVTQNGQTLDVYHQYSMALVKCDFNMTISLSGTGSDAGGWPPSDSNTPNWAGANIWITLTPNNFAYFKGNPSQVFFAPALVQIKNTHWGISGYDYYGGDRWSPTTEERVACINMQSVNPSNPGSVLGIYYAPGGSQVNIDTSSGIDYKGQTLDPSIFRDKYYVNINLAEFQAKNYFGTSFDPLAGFTFHHWIWPSVTFDVQMYVWVVGDWVTYFKPGQVISYNPPDVNVPVPPNENNFMLIALMVGAVACCAVILVGYGYQKKKKL
jgi:hypothetical protein